MAVPAIKPLWFLFTAGLIFAGGTGLRFVQIDQRPLHADEAVQAYQTWQLMRGNGYTYDPQDKHGPFLYYCTAGIATVCGWTSNTLNEHHVRTIQLLAGWSTLILIFTSASRIGVIPALVAAGLLSVAPLVILYDTYFIQEAWFALETWAIFFALMRLLEKPSLSRAVIVGMLAGLMQATKETSVLHFTALAVTLLLRRPCEIIRHWREALSALFAGLAVYTLFYSNFGSRWQGVIDGVLTYFIHATRAVASEHSQPWYYYLHLLWPHSVGGVHWGEPVLLALSGLGALTAFRRKACPSHRSIATFSLVLLTIYSAIPYKTPWLLLTPYIGLALLGGFGVVSIATHWRSRAGTAVAGLLTIALLGGALLRTHAASGRYASDERNPYLYQGTSSHFPKLLARLRGLKAAGRTLRLAVVSPDHAWPLPWYLRNESTTGYFASMPSNNALYDALLVDSRITSFKPSPTARPYGLRPDVLLWLDQQSSAQPH